MVTSSSVFRIATIWWVAIPSRGSSPARNQLRISALQSGLAVWEPVTSMMVFILFGGIGVIGSLGVAAAPSVTVLGLITAKWRRLWLTLAMDFRRLLFGIGDGASVPQQDVEISIGYICWIL